MDQSVIDRIKKLLKLSKSNNEHEAALAAERAAELMRQHNISQAEIRLGEDSRPAEQVVTKASRFSIAAQRWRVHLAQAAAAAYDCFVYGSHDHPGPDGKNLIVFLGRESAVQASQYTTDYFIKEVERLTRAAWQESSEKALGLPAKGWMASYRLGMCVTIHERCRLERDRRVNEARAKATSNENTALVVVAKDVLEVVNAYERLNLVNKGDRTRPSKVGAYEQGRADGHNVRLNGGTGLAGRPATPRAYLG